MRISDWSSDVCSSDLQEGGTGVAGHHGGEEMRLLRDRCHAAQQQHIALVGRGGVESQRGERRQAGSLQDPCGRALAQVAAVGADMWRRSEEHTSELQSLMRNSYAVFCLKKKKHVQQR